MDQHQIPKWLLGFLEPAYVKHHDRYFAQCTEHNHDTAKSKSTEQNVTFTKKSEKNYFCVDCIKGPLCETGFKFFHRGHMVLQVRKASHTEGVHIDDISRLVNIDYIQTYVNNQKKIVFLQRRPQNKSVKGSPSYCDDCKRSLHNKEARFCSLSCKFKVIEGRPGYVNLTLFLTVEEQTKVATDAGSDLLRPASPSPAILETKRPRITLEEFPSAALMVPPHQTFDKLDSTHDGRLLTSELLSCIDHETGSVSHGYESSSSQDSLETRYLSCRIQRRKG